MAQTPSLIEDLVEEILLRFLPDDPGSLLRAALVSKSWCRLVSSPRFNRRFREFHQRTSPALLGFFSLPRRPFAHRSGPLANRLASGDDFFIPLTSSFRLQAHGFAPNWRAVDARHGRILFYDKDVAVTRESVIVQFIVWNPITGEKSRLPSLSVYARYPPKLPTWGSVLLCDHVDNGQGPFRVVIVCRVKGLGFTSACVYSSKQHVWSTTKYSFPFGLLRERYALVGNALYFKCHRRWILEYDMSKHELSSIRFPIQYPYNRITLMRAEDGRLGFARVAKSKLYTWSREVDLDGVERWVQQRVFELDNKLPVSAFPNSTSRRGATRVVAAENALSVVYIGTCNPLFVIDLKLGQARKIYESSDGFDILSLVPSATFCTPVVRSGLYI